MESEAISIDEYLDSDVEQRFDFLYENYAVLKAIIKDYREDIITDVIEMKSYNRRAANGELGVRAQVDENKDAEKIYLESSDMAVELYRSLGFEDMNGYMKLNTIK